MSVHSDICPPSCNPESLSDKEWREFLHANLDEWLNKSNGSGGFYIKGESYKFDMHYGEE